MPAVQQSFPVVDGLRIGREVIGDNALTIAADSMMSRSHAALRVSDSAVTVVDASTNAGDTLAVATNLAYPICDLTLLALVATAAALDGWRLGARWLVLASGLGVLAISDVVGDDLSVIASGPTVPDASRFEDAVAVLRRFGGLETYPDAVVARLLAFRQTGHER